MRIAILNADDANYDDLWVATRRNKYEYCLRHGYELVHERFVSSDRTGHWGRVKAIEKHLPFFDYIFYLDTDIVITNPNIRIEEYLDDAYDCVVGVMPTAKHVSTSGAVIRNCQWSFEMLTRWWDTHVDHYESSSKTTNRGGLYFDQSGFHKMLDECDWVRERVKVLWEKGFNNENWSWQKGDFCLHVPGASHKEKLRCCEERLGKLMIEQ